MRKDFYIEVLATGGDPPGEKTSFVILHKRVLLELELTDSVFILLFGYALPLDGC